MLQTIQDFLLTVIGWALLILAISPIVGAIGWEIWQGQIRPRLIPEAEIEAIASEMFARYGDQAEEMAFINEDRAWRYSDSFEQGKWRRVRNYIAR
ncbi:MAG TPA: hypothetical protein VHC00_19325 [Rhizobiaceae bacterium]|nr:hypothetical protein [Rhizobiaceae bacterium]